MRIGILGAPGAGKSKLVRALAKEHGLTPVDGYVQRLQKATDLALGPWASYSEHFMVAGHRLAAENKAGLDKRVCAGTIIDSIVYAAVKSDVAMAAGPDAARAVYLSAQASMQGLALIYSETWDYDISFWLPYSEEERLARSGTWEVAIDDAYPAVVESYSVPNTFAFEGGHFDRLKVINDTIEMIENASTETSETD